MPAAELRAAVLALALAATGAGTPALAGPEKPPETGARKLPQTEKRRPAWAVDLCAALARPKWRAPYTDSNNITGRPLGRKGAKAYADAGLARALAAAENKLAKLGYGIEIHDAYRQHKTTIALWNAARILNMPDDTYACPYRASDHNRGAAVDICLYRLDGLPGPEKPSEIDAPEPPEISPEAKYHKTLLRETMVGAGFKPHHKEWWHFSFPPAQTNMPGDWRPF